MVNRELTAMRTIYSIVALLVLSSTAQAWEIRSNCVSSRYYGTSSCRWVGREGPPSRDYAQEEEDLKAKQQRIREWESFCKPVAYQDKFGVERLVYAKANCDFGRTR